MDQTPDKTTTDFSIHPATKIASVSLTVANRTIKPPSTNRRGDSAAQARRQPGCAGHQRKRTASFVEQPGHKRYQQVTGLYHFAVLFPNRRELARVMARLFVLKYPNYPTDHILTKTTYLDDPEGNGIELYCESPEDGSWSMKDGEYITTRADGTLSNGREALDVDALFSHLEENPDVNLPVPPETRIGHVHLHVRGLREAVDFYHNVIGFDIMGVVDSVRMAFVSAGGYHHHVGLNTWQGEGAPHPPADALGLHHFTIELPRPGCPGCSHCTG